ncbi:EcsC family protein [Moraxella cuniculi]|uniref:EcsC protein family n=1 Tax=Moraxella cuniculi TaxID=34061 RepID=A0A3S4QP07_9GAMM|nr:EcsC family protein [Moraxella cuniculi]VEG12774.1 EcsC protein family [Moraxella cuniculi]
MSNLISSETMYEVMEWAYKKANNGIGFGSAEEMANDYLSESGSLEDRINSLIRWQNAKAGSTGFATGLGGLITLPATLPANIASTLYIQIRMISAIAHMAGYDIQHDKVKTMVYMCLLGNGAGEVLKDFGVTAGTKFAEQFITKKITGEMLTKINKAIGFRLVTKAGSTGLINLTKLVPVLGGVVSGTFDAVTTNIVGNTARNIFLDTKNQNFDGFRGNVYNQDGTKAG